MYGLSIYHRNERIVLATIIICAPYTHMTSAFDVLVYRHAKECALRLIYILKKKSSKGSMIGGSCCCCMF